MSLGPGDRRTMVPEALQALQEADVVVGYKTYLELVADLLDGKRVMASGMKREIDRCQSAIDLALGGDHVALVSSGDAGIYGMAGLVLDLCRERQLCAVRPGEAAEARDKDEKGTESEAKIGSGAVLEVSVIPGVPAFNAAASLVGAPLMHDFAAVSLSDHLTPWELIERRLEAVAQADFVLAIYNPRSKTRPHLLEHARDVLLRHKAPETPVAIVRRAMREGQWTHLTTLATLPVEEVDMQSVLLVGNSQTYVWDGWMVTPRGYLDKYSL